MSPGIPRLSDLKVPTVEIHHDGQSFLRRIGSADIEGQPALGANGTAARALEIPLAGLRAVQHTFNPRRGLGFTPAVCACCRRSVGNPEPLLNSCTKPLYYIYKAGSSKLTLMNFLDYIITIFTV